MVTDALPTPPLIASASIGMATNGRLPVDILRPLRRGGQSGDRDAERPEQRNTTPKGSIPVLPFRTIHSVFFAHSPRPRYPLVAALPPAAPGRRVRPRAPRRRFR